MQGLVICLVLQAKQPAVSEAPNPAPPAQTTDFNQLQAMLHQRQAAQQLQARQAARAGMWPDQTARWQLAQLQQMMQGAGQPAPQMPHCSMGGLSQETLNTLAQAQVLQGMFSHGAGAVGTAALPASGQAPAATVPAAVSLPSTAERAALQRQHRHSSVLGHFSCPQALQRLARAVPSCARTLVLLRLQSLRLCVLLHKLLGVLMP